MRRFNPERELRKIQHGNKNKVLYGIILLLLIISIGSTYALYQVRYSKRIIYTKVAPFSNTSDLDLSIYVNGEKRTEAPDKDDGYTFIYLICEKDYTGEITWDYENKSLSIVQTQMPIPNKCNAFFINNDYDGITTFEYKQEAQEYIVKKDGLYKIELWGAHGGGDNGGNGAYTSGVIELKNTDKLYFYVGGAGDSSLNHVDGGYNGGGDTGGQGYPGRVFASGGGATDVRLESNGNWDDFESLKSRIMVAAGGGGSYNGDSDDLQGRYQMNGGSGGGLIGYNGRQGPNDSFCFGTGATQTLGGAPTTSCSSRPSYVTPTAPFGKAYSDNTSASGGGGGYYGGGRSGHIASAGGGSSFISGHKGCNAIDDDKSTNINNMVHTGEPNHYSGKVFANTIMIDGEGYFWTDTKQTYFGMPTFDGKTTMQGNTSNGYAKVIYIGN